MRKNNKKNWLKTQKLLAVEEFAEKVKREIAKYANDNIDLEHPDKEIDWLDFLIYFIGLTNEEDGTRIKEGKINELLKEFKKTRIENTGKIFYTAEDVVNFIIQTVGDLNASEIIRANEITIKTERSLRDTGVTLIVGKKNNNRPAMLTVFIEDNKRERIK
nr:MAG TPA: hypothetical protein [Caudoviricetes sp.]